MVLADGLSSLAIATAAGPAATVADAPGVTKPALEGCTDPTTLALGAVPTLLPAWQAPSTCRLAKNSKTPHRREIGAFINGIIVFASPPPGGFTPVH